MLSMQSTFSKLYENSTDIRHRIIQIRSAFNGNKNLQQIAPVSQEIINNTVDAYKKIKRIINVKNQITNL